MNPIPPNYVQNSQGEWSHPSRVVRNAPQSHGTPPPSHFDTPGGVKTPKRIKPRLNELETLWREVLVSRGIMGIMEQAITLRLDPPFKSYTPDLAFLRDGRLRLVEVKGPHRFREKGIAKAALAAKTYPQFRFELADWTGSEWRESVLSP